MPTTYTPALRTMAALQKLVLNYVQARQDDTDLNDIAEEALNAAIGRVNTRKWKKLVNVATITLSADDADYLFSANSSNDFKETMALLRLNSSSERDGRIPFKDLQSFYSEHQIATESGTPKYYTIQYEQRAVLLNVPPSSAFVTNYPTLQHWYYRRLDELENTNDNIGIPPDFEWFLIWHARSEIAEHRGDTRKADRALQLAERHWQELVRDDTDIMSDWSI